VQTLGHQGEAIHWGEVEKGRGNQGRGAGCADEGKEEDPNGWEALFLRHRRQKEGSVGSTDSGGPLPKGAVALQHDGKGLLASGARGPFVEVEDEDQGQEGLPGEGNKRTNIERPLLEGANTKKIDTKKKVANHATSKNY